jgi:hypothetical protein
MKSNIQYKAYNIVLNGQVMAQAEYPAAEANSWWYNTKVWTPEGGFIKSAQHLNAAGHQFDLVEA